MIAATRLLPHPPSPVHSADGSSVPPPSPSCPLLGFALSPRHRGKVLPPTIRVVGNCWTVPSYHLLLPRTRIVHPHGWCEGFSPLAFSLPFLLLIISLFPSSASVPVLYPLRARRCPAEVPSFLALHPLVFPS